MNSLKVSSASVWDETQIVNYLDSALTPLRLACVDSAGFPVVCSLWFFYQDGCLWSASHQSAHIIKLLKANAKVGFEVGTNDYPYRGVRGTGVIELTSDGAESVLSRLIDRYLGDTNKTLSNWLLSRADDEMVLRIHPEKVSSWDFSNRMESR